MSDRPACAARWATSNRAHLAGDVCGMPATERVGDVDLCGHHHQRALGWFYRRIEEMPERHEQARRTAAEKSRLLAEERSIVYCLRSEVTGLIKIGTTTRYPSRLADLRSKHGPPAATARRARHPRQGGRGAPGVRGAARFRRVVSP